MDRRFNSDHAILLLTLPCEVVTSRARPTIKRGSKTGYIFSADLRKIFSSLPGTYDSYDAIQQTCNNLYQDLDCVWHLYATNPRPSRHSNSWWNDECSEICKRLSQMCSSLRNKKKQRKSLLANPMRNNMDLDIYTIAISKNIYNTQAMAISLASGLKGGIRRAKRQFYDSQLKCLADNKLWDIVNWTMSHKTTSNVALSNSITGDMSLDPMQVARILANQFTANGDRTTNLTLLSELPVHTTRDAIPISSAMIRKALAKNSNSSTSGPDHIFWYWLKQATTMRTSQDLDDQEEHTDPIRGLRDLYNACLTFGCFPKAFKHSVTVVLPKPNKKDYSQAKLY
jgi:hypothetical protein